MERATLFSLDRMARAYQRLYRQLQAGEWWGSAAHEGRGVLAARADPHRDA